VDDNISVVIDPFFDQRNGFCFQPVNPAGARGGRADFKQLRVYGPHLDGSGTAHARITNEGWIAEIA